MGENGFDALVTERVEMQGAPAGFFEPFGTVEFSQSHNAQAGAESLLRVGPGRQDAGDELAVFAAVFSAQRMSRSGVQST